MGEGGGEEEGREEERGRGGEGGRRRGGGEGREGGGEYKLTGGHWPFSVHFSKMANQNINQCSPQDFLKV